MSLDLSPSSPRTAWQPVHGRNPAPTIRQDRNTPSSPARDRDRSSRETASVVSLTPEELKVIEQLEKIDQEVRNHEMAHVAAGGRYVTSGAQLRYRRGPDGINYAVAGEVAIDTSPVPGDPRATAEKMRTVQRAALAPASPSPQDRKVAAQAAAEAAKATAELVLMQARSRAAETAASGQGRGMQYGSRSGDPDTEPGTGTYLDIRI